MDNIKQALIYLAQEIDDLNNWRNSNTHNESYTEDQVKRILGDNYDQRTSE